MRVSVAMGHRFFLNNGKVVSTDFLIAAENVGALDQILQFAEIAWETIFLELGQSVGVQPSPGHFELGGHLMAESIA